MSGQEVLLLCRDVFNDNHTADRIDDVLSLWVRLESVRNGTYSQHTKIHYTQLK